MSKDLKSLKPINTAVNSAMGILQAHQMIKTHGAEKVVQLMTATLDFFPLQEMKVEFIKLLIDAQCDFTNQKTLAESLYVVDIMILGQAGKLDDSGAPPLMATEYIQYGEEVWAHLTATGFDFELHKTFISESRENLEILLEQLQKDQ